ncbi:MAG: ABC transporter substrate-binding protein [Deltaproteobacteria bacterium]|nr:ABC transporter substrate-binding protein [Deltaproteobacteria bacterium]
MRRFWVCLLSVVLGLGGLITTVTAAAEPGPVRIGYLKGDIHQLACWVALEKGFYQEQGLQVEVAGIFKAGPEEMSAFSAGELDMGYVGEAPATTAVANGAAQVQVVAQVNTEGSALVVGQDSAIRSVGDLAGKTVAIPGHSTVQDFLLQKALSQAQLDPSQVKIMVVKPPEMIGALRTKQIDAFIAWEPYPAKAQTLGVGRVLLASGQIWPDHPCCVLVADKAFQAQHPGQVPAMVAAHIESTDFIKKNPREALAIGVQYTGMDAATVRLALQSVKYTYAISVQGEKEYVTLLNKMGYIKLPDGPKFVESFLNPTYLNKVLGK